MDLFRYLMVKNDHNYLKDDDLFSYKLAKGQGGTYAIFTGTTINATNTRRGKMKVNLLGNTSQDTTTGKNLASLETSGSIIGGVSFTKVNGVININGTTTGSANYFFDNFQTNSGSAVFWIEVTGYTDKTSANASFIIQVSNNGTDGWSTLAECGCKSTATHQQNVTLDSSKYYRVRWYTDTNTFTNATIKVQLEYGNSKTSFEEYTGGIASPNPSYPQQIHEVSGDNTITTYGSNIFDLKGWLTANNVSYTENSDGSISTSAISTIYSNAFVFSDTNISVSMSGIIENVTSTNARFQLLNSSNTVVGEVTSSTTKVENVSACKLRINYSTTGTVTLKNIMLNTGSTAQDYTPYQSSTYPVNLPVENLFDESQMTYSGYWNANGTLNPIIESKLYWRTDYIYLISNNIYFSDESISRFSSVTLLEFDKDKSFINSTKVWQLNANLNNITIDANTKYIAIQWEFTTATDYTNHFKNFQIELGDKANSYTPYGTTPIELCKISTYQDSFFKAVTGNSIYDNLDSATKESLTYGEWYLEKKIGKVVLDGSEDNWSWADTNKYNVSISGIGTQDALCDYFSYFQYISDASTPSGTFSINPSKTVFGFVDKTVGSLTNFKTWLSTHNTIVYYVLSTPTYTQITGTLKDELNALQGARSYDEQTNISQVNNDLASNMEAQILVNE